MNKVRLFRIPAKLTTPIEEIILDVNDVSMEPYQKLLGSTPESPTWVERVTLRKWKDTARLDWEPIILVDEEGLLKKLPGNFRATALYHGGEVNWFDGSYIAGDALFLIEQQVYSVEGPENEWTSVPDDLTPDQLQTMIMENA